MREERAEKIKTVAAARQLDLAVVLENVHDAHNIGAVLRSCDAVGVQTVYVLYTAPHLRQSQIELGKRSSAGARKWVDVVLFRDPAACFAEIKQKYQRVLATHLGETRQSLFQLDLTQPTALLFGNEDQGLSPEALAYADGNFVVPQVGMVESLNISVACAITLYEAMRQRTLAGAYPSPNTTLDADHQSLWSDFNQRHHEQFSGRQPRG